MSALRKTLGRLLGGLSHIPAYARIRAFLGVHKDACVRLGWNLAGGVIGCAIGLLGVTLWLRYQ